MIFSTILVPDLVAEALSRYSISFLLVFDSRKSERQGPINGHVTRFVLADRTDVASNSGQKLEIAFP